MTDPIEPMTWWSPAGFVQDMPTLPYVAALNAQEAWSAALPNADYELADAIGSGVDRALEVWRHRDGHLYVDLTGRASFLVAPEHQAAFWFTLFPTVQASELEIRRTEALELQAKALVAWIRHGAGTSTIDEFGFTRDENRRWQEDQRQRDAQAKPKA